MGAGIATPDTKIVPLRGRADTAISRNPRTQRCVHAVSKEKEGTAVPATAAPQHRTTPIATTWGTGRGYDCPPPFDSSAQWCVHAILSGSGYRRVQLNGVCAQLVAGWRALPTQTACRKGADTAVSARDPTTHRRVQSVGSSVHPYYAARERALPCQTPQHRTLKTATRKRSGYCRIQQ